MDRLLHEVLAAEGGALDQRERERGRQGDNGVSKGVEFYYATWCGYCKAFRPEWEKLKPLLTQRGFYFTEIESVNGAVMRTEKIDGYPTLKLVVNGRKSEYRGRLDTNSIMQELLRL